jgi:hypothetical protein
VPSHLGYQGDTRGLRFTQQAYERFIVNDVERADCFVLGQISRADLVAIRNRISSIASREDVVRKAMQDRQVRLLADEADGRAGAKRAPAGAVATPQAGLGVE